MGGNKDAKYGIYKYDARFAFPVVDAAGETEQYRAYTCNLVILNASNGKKYLYDVINIKEDATTAGGCRIKPQKKLKKTSRTAQKSVARPLLFW